MMKLFRRIRQKLIDKGKLKSYFLYALGEILLVVVGILIAINLNNSNQDEIADIDLRKKLNKVREEIYQDSLRYRFIMEFNLQRIETIEKSISFIEEELNFENYQYLVKVLIEDAGSTKTFSPNSQTYAGLLNSGEFSKITDEFLKDKISFLYSYYEHMSKLNYNSIENIRSFNQEMYSSGILRAKYLKNGNGKLSEEGFHYLQNMLNNPKQKIIFENYLFHEMKLSETIIRRCQQILDAMQGIPSKSYEK